MSRDEAGILTDRFAVELDRLGRYIIMPRSKMAEVLKLQDFSRSDSCSAAECALEAGRLLTVRFMVYGSVGKIGQLYTLNTYLVDVESGATTFSATTDHQGGIEDFLTKAVRSNAHQLLGLKGEQQTQDWQVSLPKDLLEVRSPQIPEITFLASGSDAAREKQSAASIGNGLPIEVKTRKGGIVLRLVPAGTFQMGNPQSASEEDRPRTVTISHPFYIGKYEITQDEWTRVMGVNPSRFQNTDRNPAENLNWNEAQDFCRRLEGAEDAPRGSYRLPTEAEWEYACRAGTETVFYTGNDKKYVPEAAHFGTKRSTSTQPVGQKMPNAWGLYDMMGNVSEWCLDWYGVSDKGASATDPAGPPIGQYRVQRGGCWHFCVNYCESSCRSYYTPGTRDSTTGLRIVRDLSVSADDQKDSGVQPSE